MVEASFRAIQDIIKQTQTFSKKKPPVLIVVGKKQPPEKIEAALKYGHRVFGENQVQEAIERWQGLKKNHADIELHFIGSIQSNKVKDIVGFFDVIHSVDREKIVDVLVPEMQKQNRNLPCFIQVNTGEEQQKSGVAPKDIKEFHAYCKKAGLNIIGLMTIPPIEDSAAFHFALLKKYADGLRLENLSMGMSDDFEQALIYGATHIRIGSKLFGERS